MKKTIIVSLLILNFNFSMAEDLLSGNILSEISVNKFKNENEVRLNILDGEFFVKMPKNHELYLNADENTTTNEDGEDLGKTKEFSSLGGRYSYYGIKKFSLGFKGSLDYDHFFELNKNEFDFKKYKYDKAEGTLKDLSEYYKTYEDVGIKFFAEGVQKVSPRMALILMNELTFDKLESNLPKGHETIEPTLTITPKFIYEIPVMKSSKFLTEIYSENRKYHNRTLDLEGKYKVFYSKFVITQHFIIDAAIGDKVKIKANNSLSFEQISGNKNAQILLKISPRINYSSKKIDAGIAGGEYKFEDEMGMNFDYYELIAYKLVGKPQWKSFSFADYWKYEASALSVKSFIEYKFNEKYAFGQDVSYKSGHWTEIISDSKNNVAYLKETIYKTYIKYQEKLINDLYLKILLDYTQKRYDKDLIIEMKDANSVGLTLGFKYEL